MFANVEGSVRVASVRRLIKLWLGQLVVCGAAGVLAATPLLGQAPDEDWRTITTEHFRVTFPAHLESLGRQAAGHAELAYAQLSDVLLDFGEGPIDLLVTDDSDLSNGFARLKPSRRITVFAAPPTDGLQLGYYDNWLELVITHELAHIAHLDHTGTVLAIESLCAGQALDLHRPLKAARAVEAARKSLRRVVAHLDGDRVMAGDIAKAKQWVESEKLRGAAERICGSLR